MIVIVPADGDTLESQASQFFGRCSHFIVAVVENGEIKEWNAFPNPALDQAGGAGIAAAQFAAEHEANAVIAFAVGPKAGDALQRLGIKVFVGVSGTVQENIGEFIKKELNTASTSAAPPQSYGRGPGAGAGRRKAPGTGRGLGRGRGLM